MLLCPESFYIYWPPDHLIIRIAFGMREPFDDNYLCSNTDFPVLLNRVILKNAALTTSHRRIFAYCPVTALIGICVVIRENMSKQSRIALHYRLSELILRIEDFPFKLFIHTGL